MYGEDPSATTSTQVSFSRAMQQIADLVEQIESSAEPQCRELSRRLTRTLLDVHREGLFRVWSLLEASGKIGQPVREACLADPLVNKLLMLHDLHPESLETRVQQALAKVRLHLSSHGAEVALVTIEDEAVHLRLIGDCDGCHSATQSMKQMVEDALYDAAADSSTVVWEAAVASPARPSGGFVPIETLGKR